MYSKSLILGAALASLAFAGPQSGDPNMPNPTQTDGTGPTPTGGPRENMFVRPTPPLATGSPDSMPQPASDVLWATGLSRHPHQPEATGRKHLFSEETLEKMYKKWCGVCPTGQVCFPPSSIVRRQAVDCMINKPMNDMSACPQAKGHCGPPETKGGLGNETLPHLPGVAQPTGRPPFHILKPVENDKEVAPSGVSSAADPSVTDAPADPSNTDAPTTEPTDA